MSIAASLTNALSGLNAASRSAQTVSSNLANALVPGYAPRALEVSTAAVTGGVRIEGEARALDRALLADRRLADAAAGDADTRSAALERITDLIGSADDPASVGGRVAAFEAQLVSATARPDSTVRLEAAVTAARGLTAALRDASAGVQQVRQDADAAIARDVAALNDGLAQVARLNREIAGLSSRPGAANGLMDQRQDAVDSIARIVPLRTLPRDRDTLAIVTTGGQMLLDGRAWQVEFDAAGAVGTGSAAGLSGLSVNGRAVTTGTDGRMGGGSLSAAFAVRDELGPQAQSRLDGFARDLIARFEAPGADPTRAPGGPGLFTDAGAALDPVAETGLAGRIALNSLADPSAGGAAWRLRDGLGAAAPGPSGDATGLNRLIDTLNAAQVPVSGGLGPQARDVSGLAVDLAAFASADLAAADAGNGFAQARLEGLTARQLAQGVDSDQELQKLMLIERAYAANARVVETADQMIRRLLEI